MPAPQHGFCAIDFGTSNSAIALPRPGGVELVELEAGQRSMPTAVFYAVEGLAGHEEAQRHYGRAAVAAYVEGIEGRLMRSMKSILGSTLAEQSTEVGAGRSVRYLDVVGSYLRRLKSLAEAAAARPLTRAVLGRPVYFVDDDAQRDASAQAMLERAAREAGFTDIAFQYEPIAAALDHETTVDREQRLLVADIGGGTSDFSLVRIGPKQRKKVDRRDDILANHGVHVAGRGCLAGRKRHGLGENGFSFQILKVFDGMVSSCIGPAKGHGPVQSSLVRISGRQCVRWVSVRLHRFDLQLQRMAIASERFN